MEILNLMVFAQSPSEVNVGEHIVVTGAFGTQFTTFFTAPEGCRPIVFSNNPEAEVDAVEKGWEFHLLNHGIFALSSDHRISSLQSKYVKFLRFTTDQPEFAFDSPLTYIDHKVPLTRFHLEWLRQTIVPWKAVLLRKTPMLKLTISEEITAALPYDRYAFSMSETVTWLSRMKSERGVKDSVRIMNTGLIHYADVPAIRPLIDEVFEVSWELGQPECQVIWAALMQSYADLIQCVEWSDMGIEPKLP